MRKLFSQYGLMAIALLGSFVGISIFISAYFGGGSSSLNGIVGLWADHLM